MYIIGIDIGTTTISIVVMETESGMLAERRTIEHHAFCKGELPENRIQDPRRIWSLTEAALQELYARHGKPCGIGLTGQMHGMLYVDSSGDAASPLYTWQDGLGNRRLQDGRTGAEFLTERAGNAAAGYGLTTHYCLGCLERIPEQAVKMTTISDYVAMKLTGRTEPLIAEDMAASWGCYDMKRHQFCMEQLDAAGADISYLPRIMAKHDVIGQTPEGIPVLCSAGDNQASVLGTVQSLQDTVLLNVGTGSQVSVGTAAYMECSGSVELRPCPPESYLLVGSGLCGGRAYAMLEQFYRELSGGCKEDLYQRMQEQAEQFLAQAGKARAWKINTAFSGTRRNPGACGSINGIRTDNFTPGAMTAGMILGILEELYGYYGEICRLTGRRASKMVGSGNGLRKNPLMRRLAEELFGLEMKIPVYQEEAACGAAFLAMARVGAAGSLKEAQQKIVYQTHT